jgi:hypothetical protein
MRIQETDRILKESRNARHAQRAEEHPGLRTRAWNFVSSLPDKLTTMFRRG